MNVNIEEIKKLSFIIGVTLAKNKKKLKVTFKPVILLIPKFTRYNHGHNYGKRYLYLGKQVMTISENEYVLPPNLSGEIRHSHVSREGRMCMGYTQEAYNITKLLQKKKFKEYIIGIWIWLHIHEESDSYRYQYTIYDECLRLGFPVFDANNKRIKINELKRIITKEQKVLTKSSNYKKNNDRLKRVTLK